MTRIPLFLLASAAFLLAAPNFALAGGGGGGGKYRRPTRRARPVRRSTKYQRPTRRSSKTTTVTRRSGKSGSSASTSRSLSYAVKRQLADSRRSRLQYKSPAKRRGFTGVREAKALTSALKRNGMRKVDVKAVKNFLDKAFVEGRTGERRSSEYLKNTPRSYVVSKAGARTFNSFFAKQGSPVRATPKSWMSNATLSR
jgi:hypothetical protein